LSVINKNSLFQGQAKEVINCKVLMFHACHEMFEMCMKNSERNSNTCSAFERLLIDTDGRAGVCREKEIGEVVCLLG
jgi:hypothetical protein